jgi:hypothetical protein
VYVVKPMQAAAPCMLRWYSAILRQYGAELPSECMLAPYSGLWKAFQSATRLFLVLYHYFGPNTITSDSPSGGSGASQSAVLDSKACFQLPRDLAEHR